MRTMPLWLSLIGRLSRGLPYFRGKWRMADFLFHHWHAGTELEETIVLLRDCKMLLHLSDEVDNNIWWLGLGYETRPTAYFRSVLLPGLTVLDVGANIGFFSFVAACSGCTVHAFEPSPDTYRALVHNVSLNPKLSIIPVNAALADVSATLPIYGGDAENSGSNSLAASPGASVIANIRTARLDDLYAAGDFEAPSVIKIDVEGYELAVLRGAEELLRKLRPLLFIEVRDSHLRRAGTTRADLYAWLAARNYAAYGFDRSGRCLPLATPQDGLLVLFRPK